MIHTAFHKRFQKQYLKCSENVRQKTRERIKVFRKNPGHPLLRRHALQGKWIGYMSINITGDYRALYRVLSENAVEFVYLDTHSNLYK